MGREGGNVWTEQRWGREPGNASHLQKQSQARTDSPLEPSEGP